MKPAPIGADEADRLAALHRYRILDTAPEAEFNDFTEVAAQICGTPIALVSLVDADRQWFKSRIGLEIEEAARDTSFCGHAIYHEGGVFEVPDTLLDARFADNPLVSGDPRIRFYAGAPLVTPGGHAVGTLCVIDSVPHVLTPAQRGALLALGRQVVRQMEQRLLIRREKRLYAELSKQAKFQKVLLDSAVAAVISTDQQGLITSFNPAAERLLGYRAEEVIGRERTRLFHVKEELEARAGELALELGREIEVRDAIVAKAAMGLPDTHEWSYRRKDGMRVPVMLSVSALHDDAGRVSGYIGLSWDITERKQADLALRQSQERLQLAMDAAKISLWDADLQTQCITLDARWNELAGYAAEEVRMSFDQLAAMLPDEDARIIRHRIGAVLRGESAEYVTEHRVRHRLGHWFWVESRGRVMSWDAAGRPLRMLGIAMDVSARKKADEDLRSSEARLQLAMGAARTCLWDANSLTGQVVLDAHWAELIGAPPGEVETTFQDLLKVVAPDDLPQIMGKIMAVIKGEQTDYIAEQRVRHRDGRWIWVESRGRVVERDARGYAVRMIGTNTDISERKRVEQLKSEFLATVSHELRTPLTSISGALGLVRSGALGPLPEKMLPLMDIASRDSQLLTRLINDLLDMEKLAAGKMRFDLQSQALMLLVEQAIESTRPYAQQYGVNLVLTQRADAARVRVDGGRLQQVLGNYLSNAAKFSPQGAQVDVAVLTTPEKARVEVIDRGPGIPEEFRKRIFEKFSQADASNTRQKGGTGLGLAISRELIERMHGRVGFESQEGQGSRFYFELPLVQEPGAGGPRNG